MLGKSVAHSIGHSHEGRDFELVTFAPAGKAAWTGPWLLLLGGVHGDEIEGVWLTEEMIRLWREGYPYRNLGVVVWPRMNPDGVAKKQRWNSRGVDLNRNLPTRD